MMQYDVSQRCVERPDSWVTQEQFKAGLAIIQAMPGPMFNLSAYLGAVIAVRASWNVAVGVAACWLGLFGPGIMLLYGLLPFWGRFRQSEVYRRALPGLNAAAVGLVVMAVFSMYESFTCVSSFRNVEAFTRLASCSSHVTRDDAALPAYKTSTRKKIIRLLNCYGVVINYYRVILQLLLLF
jgi:chromate transport protein ChrA